MNVIYLSTEMSSYTGANYQVDVSDELGRQADVYYYGPGYPDYDKSDNLETVLSKAGFQPDAIIIGHSWLDDHFSRPLDPQGLRFEDSPIPVWAIMNKEYLKLSEKLNFYKSKKIRGVFTHHHDVDTYSNRSGVPHTFWPFAVDHRAFAATKSNERPIDFAFSGILQNQGKWAEQSDIRVRIQSKIFHAMSDIPLVKRRKYKNLEIFWSSIPRKRTSQRIANLIGKRKHLSVEDYSQLHLRSKVFLNTLSPMGLVSPRFFESLLSGTLSFCEKSENFSRIIPRQCFVEFDTNLSDFDEKLFFYSQNESERKKITEKAREVAAKSHTWKNRIQTLLGTIEARS